MWAPATSDQTGGVIDKVFCVISLGGGGGGEYIVYVVLLFLSRKKYSIVDLSCVFL